MNYVKILSFGVIALLIATSVLSAESASATRLYRYTTPSSNDQILTLTEFKLTLKSKSSTSLSDTSGGVNDTCTSSEMVGLLETSGSSVFHPRGEFSWWTFGGCSHTTTSLGRGYFEITNIAGTTNGVMVASEQRVTVKSTIFGISCVVATGAGTNLGTVTGAKWPTETAILDINAVITLENGCGDATWTGTYLFTSPTGMTVENA